MDQTREERLQQRLRGAQRREIKEVDFGFNFPPPPPPPAAAPAPVVEETPATLPQVDNAQPGPSQAETPSQPLRRSPRRSTSHGRAVDANTSAKRRKLEIENDPPSSARSTRSSQAASRPDVYDIPNDDAVQPESVTTVIAVTQTDVSLGEAGANMSTSQMETQSTVVTVENENSQPHLPRPTHAEIPSVIEEGDSPVQAIQKKRKREEGPQAKLPQENRRRKSARISQGSVDEDVEHEEPKPKRRGRKPASPSSSSIEPAPNQQAEAVLDKDIDKDTVKPSKRGRKPRASIQQPAKPASEEVHDEEQDGEQDEAEAIEDEEAAVRLSNSRGRRVSRGAPQAKPSKEPLEAAAKKQRGRPRQRHAESPVQQSHPKSKKARTKGPGPKKATGTKKETIPVTVYRMSMGAHYDSEEEEADILNAEIPRAKQGGVNAIDVLSTFCQEIINDALNTLEQGIANTEDRADRKEYGIKYKAIEAFGEEIQSRLLQHTSYLDSIHSLQKRVRDEQKKKLALREEIMRVGREREAVALKMDQIRMQHEQEQKTFNQKATLSDHFHSIELAMDTRRSSTDDDGGDESTGIELLMKSAAAEVSSESMEGGVLRRIREFNAFLERAAGALGS